MRLTLFFSSLLLLVAANLSCATLEIDSPSIDALSLTAIAEKCGGPDLEACTTIYTEAISSCVYSGNEWRPLFKAHVTPHVFTSRSELLRHEFLHIADIGESLKKIESEIERHQFASQDTCLSFVAKVDASLPQALRGIEKQSTRRRDPPMRSARQQTTPEQERADRVTIDGGL